MNLKLVKRATQAVFTGSLRDQVQTIRARRAALVEDRKTVDGARRPLEEAEAGLGRMLDEIASTLDVDLSALADHRTDRLPELLRPASDVGNRLNDKTLLALLIASNRSSVRDVLAATLRKSYDHVGALSSEDRNRRLEAIDAELDDLERREEQIIRASEADGAGILRREDASPAIILLAEVA